MCVPSFKSHTAILIPIYQYCITQDCITTSSVSIVCKSSYRKLTIWETIMYSSHELESSIPLLTSNVETEVAGNGLISNRSSISSIPFLPDTPFCPLYPNGPWSPLNPLLPRSPGYPIRPGIPFSPGGASTPGGPLGPGKPEKQTQVIKKSLTPKPVLTVL